MADFGFGEYKYPRGWFMVARAEDLRQKPLALEFFGRKFALYRGESGRPVLLDAFCPHMGGHFASGITTALTAQGRQIEGDSIRCPYHGWRFGPDGKCNDIPYSNIPIPNAARVRSWPVREHAGSIFIWHDPEEKDPDFDLPALAQWDNPSWIRAGIDMMQALPVHAVELIDQIADKTHLSVVHGASTDLDYFENMFQDHVVHSDALMRMSSIGGAEGSLHAHNWYVGPGMMLVESAGTLFVFYATPIDETRTQTWSMLLVDSGKPAPSAEDVQMAQHARAAFKAAAEQDFEIFRAKGPCTNPMQIPGDGPVRRVRLWYSQFHNPRTRAREIQARVNGVEVTKGTRRDP